MYENQSFITLSSNIQVFSIMFNGINLQRGNVFILVFVIYIAVKIIVIMSSIIEILEILLSRSPRFSWYRGVWTMEVLLYS